MTKMFQENFVIPEHKRLAFLVKQKDGDAAIHNEQAMKELWTEEVLISTSVGNGRSGSALVGNERHRSAPKFDLVEIQREIQGDPTKAIEKNEESFDSKLRVQMRQIQERIEHIAKQGERIYSAVTGGPYERIVDPVRIPVRS